MTTQTLYRDTKGRFASKNQAVKTQVINRIKNQANVSTLPMTTHYVLVLDNSSSMSGISRATVDAVNERFNALRQQSNPNHKFTVSLITFDDVVNPPKYSLVPLENVLNLNYTDYRPSGWTALLDGVGAAIELCKTVTLNKDDAYLIEVITDGQENRSVKYSQSNMNRYFTQSINLPELMRSLHKQGVYTIVFQVPHGHKNALHRDFNIPLDNINEWENTDVGTQIATHCTTQGLNNYSTQRTLGKKAVDTFYVQADLSQVKPNDLKNLTNLSHRFKVLEVNKEQPIKEFIEEKGKCKYIIGAAYYEVLTKNELIQPQKEILVMEKGKNQIYGGKEARKLLGIPEGVSVNLSPYNLSIFKVYVQSTSVNRQLVRGTKVLVDTQKWTHNQPTWGELNKQI